MSKVSVYLSLDLSLSRSFYRSLTEPPVSKPTPLYGQPSWWGDDDEDDEDHKREPGESISNHSSAGLYLSLTIQKKQKKRTALTL